MPPSTDRPILVIDDDADLRETVGDILGYEGYSIATASNGADGLQYLRTHPAPALIILDYWMPEINGSAFVEALKREPAWADIPIAVVTADLKAAELVQQLGIDALVTKPMKMEELLGLAKRFVDGDDHVPARGA